MHFISIGWCKKEVTPLLTHWSYVFLALTHRYMQSLSARPVYNLLIVVPADGLTPTITDTVKHWLCNARENDMVMIKFHSLISMKNATEYGRKFGRPFL